MIIEDLLTEYYSILNQEASRIETDAQYYVEQYIDSLIDSIKKYVGNYWSIQNLSEMKHATVDVIAGRLHRNLFARFSMSNPECFKILERNTGEVRKKKIEAYINYILNDEIDQLCSFISSSLSDVIRFAYNEKDRLIQARLSFLREQVEQLESRSQHFTEKTDTSEETAFLPALKLTVCDLILNLMETDISEVSDKIDLSYSDTDIMESENAHLPWTNEIDAQTIKSSNQYDILDLGSVFSPEMTDNSVVYDDNELSPLFRAREIKTTRRKRNG